MTVGHIFRNFSVILHPFLIKVKKKKLCYNETTYSD